MNELDGKILIFTVALLFATVLIDNKQERKTAVFVAIAVFFIGIFTNHIMIM